MTQQQHGGWFRYRLPDGSVVDVGVSAARHETMRGIADKLAAEHGDAVFMNACTYCYSLNGDVATAAHGARVYSAEQWARMEANSEKLRNADPLGRHADEVARVVFPGAVEQPGSSSGS